MHYIFYYAISILTFAGEANDVGADTETSDTCGHVSV